MVKGGFLPNIKVDFMFKIYFDNNSMYHNGSHPGY